MGFRVLGVLVCTVEDLGFWFYRFFIGERLVISSWYRDMVGEFMGFRYLLVEFGLLVGGLLIREI